MAFGVRRVVTGHDANGDSVVVEDRVLTEATSSRAGAQLLPVWGTLKVPGDNSDPVDGAKRAPTDCIESGTICRILRYEPGVAAHVHRSETIDYAVVLSGAIAMELDRETVHLRAGDVLVQRGTRHNWTNPGDDVCVILVVLTAAEPLNLKGHVPTAV